MTLTLSFRKRLIRRKASTQVWSDDSGKAACGLLGPSTACTVLPTVHSRKEYSGVRSTVHYVVYVSGLHRTPTSRHLLHPQANACLWRPSKIPKYPHPVGWVRVGAQANPHRPGRGPPTGHPPNGLNASFQKFNVPSNGVSGSRQPRCDDGLFQGIEEHFVRTRMMYKEKENRQRTSLILQIMLHIPSNQTRPSVSAILSTGPNPAAKSLTDALACRPRHPSTPP